MYLHKLFIMSWIQHKINSNCGGARGVSVGARGVIVIVVGNEHGNTSSNTGRD